MKPKLSCSRARLLLANRIKVAVIGTIMAVCSLALPAAISAADAPGWMHAVVNVPLPDHDEKTNAVLLYSEKNVTVLNADKVKVTVRQAYKILRPAGRD